MVRGEEEGKGEESGAATGATVCDACAGQEMYVVGWR